MQQVIVDDAMVARALAGFDTGTGDQTLTLNNAMDLDDESFLHATIAGTTSGMIAVEIVSTTQIRVRTFSGADAAADKAYWISIWPVGPD